jgi:tetratricopeptide (TPR) repeat protein
VKKQQLVLVFAGILLLTILYLFGSRTNPRKRSGSSIEQNHEVDKQLDIKDILAAAESKLDSAKLSYINRLKNAVVRGDVKNQQLTAYRQLASFWKDSVSDAFLPAAYYIGETAKLENSEKSLTFAAQLFLNNLQGQHPVLRTWMADQAKSLFERVLQLNPQNDSARIGLGGAYIFGGSAGNPQELMQGIQQILQIARKDSTNMYAQFMLGLGGIESRQFDKAIERLTRVVRNQPNNLEAILALAEAYEQNGQKSNAVRWYEAGKKLVVNQDLNREIDQRIKSLQ